MTDRHFHAATTATYGVLAVASNAVAYVESTTLGAYATVITAVATGAVALYVKAIGDRAKAQAQAILEIEKAKAEAEDYRRRLELRFEAEWEQVHAHSLKGQIEQLQRQYADGQQRLQEAVNADRARTEDANRKLHDLRNQAMADILTRDEQISELKRALAEEKRLVEQLTHKQVQTKAAVEQTHAAVVETKAAVVKAVSGSSAEIPVVRPE